MNKLKNRIMRRVYLLWFSKNVLPYVAAEAVIFAGFLYLIGQNVYVAMVLKYANGILAANIFNPAVWVAFGTGIFIHTHLIVQVSVLGSLIMAVLLFKNVVTSLGSLALYR